MASYEEIKNNRFTLTTTNYIQKADKKEEIDPLELQKEILKASMELDALIEELEGIKQPKKEDCSISLF